MCESGGEDVDDSGDRGLALDRGLGGVRVGEVDAHEGTASAEVDRDRVLGLTGLVGGGEAVGEAIDY